MTGTHSSRTTRWVASVSWAAITAAGWALIAWSALAIPEWAGQISWGPFLTVVVLAMVTGLRPVRPFDLPGSEVYLWWAFSFAALYVWGLWAGLAVLLPSVLVSQIVMRKPWWALTYNTGMYALCSSAAWCLMAQVGASGLDDGWAPRLPIIAGVALIASWGAFIVVNLALVALLSGWSGETWWQSFTDNATGHVTSMLAVLALSPVVATALIATDWSWLALVCLLIPLVAVSLVADTSRQRGHLALHDPLTGLPNRTLLADRIEQALARSSRQDHPVVLLFLDLDGFKQINDTFGHPAGDALLISVARALTTAVRPSDTLARYAGDEFVIVCDDIPPTEIEPLIARLHRHIAGPHDVAGQPVTCAASIGVAQASGDTDAALLLRAADEAMYARKAGSKNGEVRPN